MTFAPAYKQEACLLSKDEIEPAYSQVSNPDGPADRLVQNVEYAVFWSSQGNHALG